MPLCCGSIPNSLLMPLAIKVKKNVFLDFLYAEKGGFFQCQQATIVLRTSHYHGSTASPVFSQIKVKRVFMLCPWCEYNKFCCTFFKWINVKTYLTILDIVYSSNSTNNRFKMSVKTFHSPPHLPTSQMGLHPVVHYARFSRGWFFLDRMVRVLKHNYKYILSQKDWPQKAQADIID